MWLRGPMNKHQHTFLPIANYPQFILKQYKEVDQKPAPTQAEKTVSLFRFGVSGSSKILE